MNVWPAKAGVDRHHQDVVHVSRDFLERDDRRRGIQHDPGLDAQLRMKVTVRWRCGSTSTWTEIIDAPASANAPRNRSGWLIIRWTSSGTVAARFSGAHDRRADRDVRHEVAVHDVHVDQVGSAALDRADRVAEGREVRGEN